MDYTINIIAAEDTDFQEHIYREILKNIIENFLSEVANSDKRNHISESIN